MDYLRNVPVNIKEVRPHFMLSVPALASNFRKNVEKGIRQKGPRVEKLFQRALRNAYRYIGDGWNRGKGLRALRAPLHKVFDRLIFSKVRARFGGKLRFTVSGSAALSSDVAEFISAMGRAPMVKMSRMIPPTPVAAPWKGSMKEGWLWDSILNTAANPCPMSMTPAFSPGPCTTRGPAVGSLFK